jgi:hypothetical protein
MSEVDINNDSITRFVVRHYKYNQNSNHFYHLSVVAFNKKREMLNTIKKLNDQLAGLKDVESNLKNEYFYGVIYVPGHFAKTSQMHMINKMIRHGVDPNNHSSQEQIPGLLSNSYLPTRSLKRRIISILESWKRLK